MMSEAEPLLCPTCKQAMKLLHTIPKAGVMPELHAYYCECGHAETIEAPDSRPE
jgi:hypothetical protein